MIEKSENSGPDSIFVNSAPVVTLFFIREWIGKIDNRLNNIESKVKANHSDENGEKGQV